MTSYKKILKKIDGGKKVKFNYIFKNVNFTKE